MALAAVGTACPRCGGVSVAGSTHPADDDGWSGFRPRVRRGWRYWLVIFNTYTGVLVPRGFRACTACGLVWGEVDPAALSAFMAKEGYEPPPGESQAAEPGAAADDGGRKVSQDSSSLGPRRG